MKHGAARLSQPVSYTAKNGPKQSAEQVHLNRRAYHLAGVCAALSRRTWSGGCLPCGTVLSGRIHSLDKH